MGEKIDDVKTEAQAAARVRLRDATLAEIDPLIALVRQLGREGIRSMDHERDGGTFPLATARQLRRQVGTLHRELSLDVRRATADLAVGAPERLRFRWLSQRDFDRVIELERLCYPEGFRFETVKSLLRVAADITCFPIVAEIDERVIAHMIAGMNRGDTLLLSLGVDPEFRRQKIATALMGRVMRRLSLRRPFLLATATDDNLPAHKFLASLGFRCTGTRQEYETPEGFTGEVYGFEFRWRPESEGSDE